VNRGWEEDWKREREREEREELEEKGGKVLCSFRGSMLTISARAHVRCKLTRRNMRQAKKMKKTNPKMKLTTSRLLP
jgi:hypothetical protein